MSVVLYKSRNPDKYYLIKDLKKTIYRDVDICNFQADRKDFKFLTHNKILVTPAVNKLHDRISIIDFDLTANYFSIFNSNIPTFHEIAGKFNIVVNPTYMHFELHGVHNNRAIIKYGLSEPAQAGPIYHYYIIVYDIVKDQVIDIFETSSYMSNLYPKAFYNDKMRYFIYIDSRNKIKIRDIRRGINLKYEQPYTSVIVVDNKTNYIYLVYNTDERCRIKIIAESLATFKSTTVETDNICTAIVGMNRVSYNNGYLVFGDNFKYYAVYVNGLHIDTLEEINKILDRNRYCFAKIVDNKLHMIKSDFYKIYNIRPDFGISKSEIYKITFNQIIYNYSLGSIQRLLDVQDMIGTQIYIGLHYDGKFCTVTGKIFHTVDDLLKFFQKNKSAFGTLIHGNFEVGLLKLIISYI
jgi:hypothetical protein